MKTRIAILISISVSVLASAQPAPKEEPKATKIFVDRAGSDIFPESWLTAKVKAKAELLNEDDQKRCKAIIEKVLAKYPKEVLSRHLRNVYVLGRLEYSGITAAGSNSLDSVYVVGQKYTDWQIEDLFHAEFSSILLRNAFKSLDKEAWEKINPPDFKYLGSGVQAVKEKKASLKGTDALREEGFMHDYAKASLEEDFNTMASRLMMGDAELWKVMEKYPKIKAKAELTMSFYKKLDAKFTQEFFEGLRKR